jgi:hypothetical protein
VQIISLSGRKPSFTAPNQVTVYRHPDALQKPTKKPFSRCQQARSAVQSEKGFLDNIKLTKGMS